MIRQWHICCDCGKRRERCRAIFKRCDGKIDNACPQCWRDHQYQEFMWRKEEL
jgi:predicted amidophosphoribosyltransferase